MNTTRITLPACEDIADIAHLEKALESVPGVESVEIDPAARQAIVQHRDTAPQRLVAAVAELGYSATVD